MINRFVSNEPVESSEHTSKRQKAIAKSVAAVAAFAFSTSACSTAEKNDTCMYDVKPGDTLSQIAVEVSPVDASAMDVLDNRYEIENLNNDYGGGLAAHPNGINPDYDLKISCDQFDTVIARRGAESDYPDVHVYKLPDTEQN